ncbi:uncharacterized protein B0H18DRAFT_994570 [Fomitopsis serialis]|uniref:uncharacterized protein n=1 Tax=Fomitopsis serialis TaxID=139415 RepID=UPI00200891AC|nr:uncharacterized protein B0H18DRAFT_994570 [Neoantrodia serialis]KAH9930351.1 hypothetical protein B0H18DRAFT_994570 [Neoantrodia serialis]
MAMASDPSSTPPYASSPFDHPKADLILRSSDHVDFRVSKFILEVSSVFFANMFEASQANDDESRDGCPVVQMQEDSETLDSLLRIIYPRKDPILDDLPKLHAVLAAALKYEMEEATNLTGAVLRSFIPKEPLRVWAIAVRNRLEEEARAAATSFPPEMLDINAGAYHRLFRYHRLEAKASNLQILRSSGAHVMYLPRRHVVTAGQNTVAEGTPVRVLFGGRPTILLFEEDSVTLRTILGYVTPSRTPCLLIVIDAAKKKSAGPMGEIGGVRSFTSFLLARCHEAVSRHIMYHGESYTPILEIRRHRCIAMRAVPSLIKIVQTYRLQQIRGDEDGAIPIKSASGSKKSTTSIAWGYMPGTRTRAPMFIVGRTINNTLRRLGAARFVGHCIGVAPGDVDVARYICAQCSQPGDQAKLTEFSKTLHAQISDEINKVRLSSCYADHIMISGNA